MDLDQIVSQTIETAEQNAADAEADNSVDTGADSSDDATAVDASADDSLQQPEPTDQTPDADPLLADYSHKNPKNNRIPYNRVQKIVAKAREEAKAAALAEANQIRERYSRYESPDFQNLMESLRVAQENPERFLDALAQADDRYAQLLQARRQAEAQAVAAQTNIQPDVVYENGDVGYSQETFDRLLNARMQAAQEAMEQKIAQRYGDMEAAFRQHRMMQGAVEQVSNKIAQAQKWPGFTENQAEITAAIQADRTLSLEDAYRNVVFGNMHKQLAQTREEYRKQFMAEMNAKSKGSVPRPSSGTAPITNTARSLEDIIKSIDKANQ